MANNSGLYEYKGEWLNLGAWAHRTGISYSTLYHRIHDQGMTIARALEVPIEDAKRRFERRREKGPPKPRPSKLYTANGKTMSLNDWAKELGLCRGTLEARMRRGLPLDEAFAATDRRGGWRGHSGLGEWLGHGRPAKTYTAHGKTLTIKQWSAELGVHFSTLSKRLCQGFSPEEALVTGKQWRDGNAERRRRDRARLEAEAQAAAAEAAEQERMNTRRSEMIATAREIITNFAFPALGKMPIRALMLDVDGGTAILEGDAGGELVYRVTVRDSGKNRIEAIGRKSGLTFCARDFWETVMINPRMEIVAP